MTRLSDAEGKISGTLFNSCTDHLVNQKSYFKEFEACRGSGSVINSDGKTAAIEGRDKEEATMTEVESLERIYSFKDVLYVPSYSMHLMSFSAAAQAVQSSNVKEKKSCHRCCDTSSSTSTACWTLVQRAMQPKLQCQQQSQTTSIETQWSSSASTRMMRVQRWKRRRVLKTGESMYG